MEVEVLENLSETQKSVALLTHVLCNIIDSSRELSQRLRLMILDEAYQALQQVSNRCDKLVGMNTIERSRSLERILEDLID